MASKFSYMDMPLQIGFQFAGPLDKYVQFESMAEAEAWKDGVLGYEGALVRVKDKTVTKNVETGEYGEDGNPITEEKVTTTWKLLKVELVNNNRVFVPASDIDVVDGKISNENLNYTVDSATADKVVVTNDKGFVDQTILNVTSEYAIDDEGKVVSGEKVVVTKKNGLIDYSLVGGVTATGLLTKDDEGNIINANEHVGKLVQVSSSGKIDSSLIPSVALGEFLGQYESWAKYEQYITDGKKHKPEIGDTIEIAEIVNDETVYSVYICVNDDEKLGVSDRFATVKSAAGAVTTGEFRGHTDNATIHITADERTDWDAKLDEVQVTDTDGINLEVTEADNVATITATLNPATTATIGGVIVGENIDVTDGKISVAAASATDYGVVMIGDHLHNNEDGKLSVNVAEENKFGVVKVGDNINLLNGVISVATANGDTLGLVKQGTNVSIVDGEVSVATADKDTLGVVQVGNNIDVNGNGVISVATANGDTLGVVKQGINVSIVNGAVSVATANGDTLGVVKQGTNVTINEKGEVSVATANGTDTLGLVKAGTNVTIENGAVSVATASDKNLGLVKVGAGLDVTADGTISANILWTEENFTLEDGEGEGANRYYQWNKVCEVKIFDENGGIVYPAEYIVNSSAKTTRIEFPADFPADGEDTTKWTVLVGPAIQ